jgi:hypothetical protein
MCTYNLLYDIVDLLINLDNEANAAVNKLIEAVFKLRQHAFDCLDWTTGVDMTIFEENIKMITDGSESSNGTELAKFNVTNATGQKQNFLSGCVEVYKRVVLKEPEDTYQVMRKRF